MTATIPSGTEPTTDPDTNPRAYEGAYCAAPEIVDEPPTVPYRFGLFSAATVTELGGERQRWQINGTTFASDHCSHAHTWPGLCGVPCSEWPPDTPPTKADGDPYQFYKSHGPLTVYLPFDQCPRVGMPGEEHTEHATERLRFSEQREVELRYWNDYLKAKAAADTVAGPLQIKQAVGVLEALLARHYGGVGVLHAPRQVEAWLTESSAGTPGEGERLETNLGTHWAFGGGYYDPASDPAAPGTYSPATIYATGAVQIRRSEIILPGTPDELFNTKTNLQTRISERVYDIATDCDMVFRVTATPTTPP